MGDFSVDLVHENFRFKLSYAKFPVMLPINEYSLHNNEQFGSCLTKIKQILSILQGFQHSLGFPSVFNWAIFSVGLVYVYLTYKIPYVEFPV